MTRYELLARIVLSFLVTGMLLTTGCESSGDDTSQEPAAVDVTGIWSYSNSIGESGTLTLDQSGNDVTGNLSVIGTSVAISGTVSGNTFTFNGTGAESEQNIVATVNNNAMYGNWSDTLGRTGTCQASRK